MVGDECPECGWIIDAPGAAWATPEYLDRLVRMSRLAWMPAVAVLVMYLLLLLYLFVPGVSLQLAASGMNLRLLGFSFAIALGLLATIQVVTQVIAVYRMAILQIGERRAVVLRVAATLRIMAFVLTILLVAGIVNQAATPPESGLVAPIELLFRLAGLALAQVLAVAADFAMLAVLGRLRGESGAIVSGWHTVVPPLARWALIGIVVLPFLPPFGLWLLLSWPLWMGALAVGFAQVGAVAEACRSQQG
jgi:hypothetical protein